MLTDDWQLLSSFRLGAGQPENQVRIRGLELSSPPPNIWEGLEGLKVELTTNDQ
jgi:hypothetical protein